MTEASPPTARRDTPRGSADTILSEVVSLGRELLDHVRPHERPVGVGLAAPGLLDPVAGVGIFSADLGWRDAPAASVAAP